MVGTPKVLRDSHALSVAREHLAWCLNNHVTIPEACAAIGRRELAYKSFRRIERAFADTWMRITPRPGAKDLGEAA